MVIFLKTKLKSEWILDIVFFILGSAAFSFGVVSLIEPNEISPGGFTGIATVFNLWWGMPIGITVFALNIPLLILQFKKFGGSFIIKTAAATFMLSLILDIGEAVFPHILLDGILAAVFGGIMCGFGLSLVIMRGATTGGADAVAKLVNSRFPHFAMGKIIMLTDLFVILLSVFAYKNIEIGMYSVITIFVSTKVIDAAIYGADSGRMVYIVTDNPQGVSQAIYGTLKRGVTVLDAKGGYTGKKRALLLCAVRLPQVSIVLKCVNATDKSAFTVVTEVGQIIGEGFRKNT